MLILLLKMWLFNTISDFPKTESEFRAEVTWEILCFLFLSLEQLEYEAWLTVALAGLDQVSDR